MNGIHAAFTGRIGKDAEVRTARDGKALGILPRGGGRQDRRRGPGDLGCGERYSAIPLAP